MTEQNTTTGPVTLDDVRAALGDTPATQTNAGAVRRTLGRGSMSTIQKHLDALRAEAAAPVLDADAGGTPPAPADLIASVWASAWAQAQARTHGALAVAQARVEVLSAELALARADADAAQADADDASAEVQATTAHAQAVESAAQAERAALEAERDAERAARAQDALAAQTALDAERAARAQEAREASQAMALAQAQHDAAQAALRAEVDRLVSQLADLRAALSRPAA